jgi:COP9 signalosome complex subunit 1
LAVDELKNTKNTALYRRLYDRVGTALGEDYPFDANWADSVDKRAQATADRLEGDLQNYTTNVLRPKIRQALNDLGEFHYQRGEFNLALRNYMRTQDYTLSQDHIIELCLNVINVSVEMGNFAHVLNYVTKAEQTPNMDANKIVSGKLKVVSGLANLESGKYKQAARKFIYTEPELGDSYNSVATSKDIAIYGGLCALAEFDRSELYRLVINNFGFKYYLESYPLMQTILQDFYDSNYASCLQSLDLLRNDMQLDIHLHDHIGTLYKRVRNKAIVQYFSPYKSINLVNMADAFKTDISALEKELSQLIVENVISARIDSHNKHLYSRQADERVQTYEQALQTGENFQRSSRSILLRVNLIRNEMIVKPTKDKGEGKRKGGRKN